MHSSANMLQCRDRANFLHR